MGLGGTINFIAGSVRRAPAFLGRIGLEWAFRLAMEPRRLAKRYGRDALHLLRTGGVLLALHGLQRLRIAFARRGSAAYFSGDSRPDLSFAKNNEASIPHSTEATLSVAELDLAAFRGADARGLETIRRCAEDPRIQLRGAQRCGRLLRAALHIHQIDPGANS